jgi:hypothetical protein
LNCAEFKPFTTMKIDSGVFAQELHELSEQLRFLESKLTSPATKLAGGQYYLDGEPVSMEVLSEFKSSLDHARHSVWALLEALAGYSGHTIEEALQNYRMLRASELLHVLRHEVEYPTCPDSAAARSFLDEVQVVADLALRRHMHSRKQ